MYIIDGQEYECSVVATLDIINDKWKLLVVWELLKGEKRFKQLHEGISQITQKTLTIKLKELEKKGIIHREVFPEVPPKVVYSLTPIAKELKPVLEGMFLWGISYAKTHGEISGKDICSPCLPKHLQDEAKKLFD